jgi:hypothetical protein
MLIRSDNKPGGRNHSLAFGQDLEEEISPELEEFMEQVAHGELNSAWDWQIPSKIIADLDEWRERFSEVQELLVSQD